MITFSKLGEYGRLGNQLFQYSILYSVAIENNYHYMIPDITKKKWHGQNCLLDNFNISAKKYKKNTTNKTYIEKSENRLKYDEKIFNISDNTDIFGYFQHFLYVKKHAHELIKELTPNNYFININREKLNKIKEKYKNYNIISLHIRRGDIDLNIFGRSNKLEKNSLWYQYLIKAKNIFKKNKVKFLIFTGGDRNNNTNNDYNWCLNNLIGEEYIHINDDNTVMNDFTLMYLCDGNILSPTSSLSWWVGFLNYNNNKKIIAPIKYLNLKKKLDDKFYPDNFFLV